MNEIKRREMQAIARAGGGDASQIEALGVPKGEGALLNYGRKPDGSCELISDSSVCHNIVKIK